MGTLSLCAAIHLQLAAEHGGVHVRRLQRQRRESDWQCRRHGSVVAANSAGQFGQVRLDAGRRGWKLAHEGVKAAAQT